MILIMGGLMNSLNQIKQPPFLDQGDEVVCPNCRNHIAYVVKKIERGTPLKSHMFLGPTIRPNAEMKCHRCAMPWFLGETGQVHLKGRGWVPNFM
jgi:hypothetical protein